MRESLIIGTWYIVELTNNTQTLWHGGPCKIYIFFLNEIITSFAWSHYWSGIDCGLRILSCKQYHIINMFYDKTLIPPLFLFLFVQGSQKSEFSHGLWF